MDKDLRPGIELKWAERPTFFAEAPLPRNQWFQVKLHLELSETQDGVAELWINGEKVLKKNMQTLPFSDIILDRVEVGLTAAPSDVDTEIYMDDVRFSRQEI